MAQKKKRNSKKAKRNDPKAAKALAILIGTCTIVWGLTSCANEETIIKVNKPVNQAEINQENKTANEKQINKEQTVEKPKESENKVIQKENKNGEQINKEEAKTEEEIHKEQQTIPQGSYDDDTFDSTINPDDLSTESKSWSWQRNKTHEPVIPYTDGLDITKYGAYHLVNTEEKVLYLTFDEGYENGYTASILDVLKRQEVQATFFVTEAYIKNNKELTIRMKEEGHLVGNHSSTHPAFPSISDDEIEKEIRDTEQTFLDTTGYKMDMFFRYPEGKYSEHTLYLIRKLGYRSIFWSIAYADWNVDNQKEVSYAINHLMENHHPGAIILLHAVSKTNAEALEEMIIQLKEEGYRFGNLYEVE